MLRAALVAIVFLLFLPPVPVPARSQQPWVPLGARRVSARGERDIIRTTNSGQFKRVRLTVEGGDLELFDIQITFADGTTFSPTGRFTFTRHARTRVIALPGAARGIRWITFFYRSLATGGQGGATVQAYGRR